MYGHAEAELAIYAETSARGAFIRRTYGHLAGAVLAFMALEAYLLQWTGAEALIQNMVGGFSWLLVLGAFMAVSWLADRWARSEAAPHTQYLGLGLFVTAEAVIFLPLLYMAAYYSSPDVIPTAGIITGLTFGGLTLTALTTERDFSFLGGLLQAGGFVALGTIAASILFGFNLGLFFTGLMILFAAGAILYNTANVMRHYRTDQHVAAALALFASVALLFWYVLQATMSLTSDE